MKFFLLINVKMPTNIGTSAFMSGKNSILGLSDPEKKLKFLIFSYLLAFKFSCSAELSMKKSFITLGPECSFRSHEKKVL